MSLPQNLGRLSAALTSDASLNIGVGVTPSGSFKLEVGTTSKFTGVATFGSTLSNGTYSYTLPGATGTLALVGGAGVGTVTSVAAITLGTTGTDLSSTVATGTTTPVITLQVPTASATNRGALSSADWSTFNGKQGALSGTGIVKSTAGVISYLTDPLPIANGGTGSATQNFVDLTTTQSIGGAKTLTSALSGTSATFSGLITSTIGVNNYLKASNISTDGLFIENTNNGNTSYYGINNSTGSLFFTGSAAYSTNIGTASARDFHIGTNGAVRLTIASTGAATFSSAAGITNGNGLNLRAGGNTASDANVLNFTSLAGTINVSMFSDASNSNTRLKSLGNLSFHTGNIAISADNERVTILSTGNVGIGTTSPAKLLDVYLGTTGTVGQYLRNTTINLLSQIDGTTSGQFGTETNHPLVLLTNNSERMRITSGGNVLINCTSVPSSSVSGFVINGASSGNISSSGSSTGAYNHLLFYNGNGLVGYIQTSGSTTTYSTSSDYRLKKDVQPITDALARIQLLNPVKYKWKCDDSDGEGFIAHELQEIIPSSVTGEKDGEEMQGVDYSKIVPILVKAIQEQQSQIEELKALIK